MTFWTSPVFLSRLRLLRPKLMAALLATAVLAACGTTGSNTASGPVPAGHYRVQPGDTLNKIARANKQSVSSLVRWNNLSNPNQIHVGQMLRVTAPASSAGGASTGGKTSGTATAPATSNTSRPSGSSASTAPTKKISLVWPAPGNIIRQFGQARSNGITIANTAGTPIVAAAAGTVAYAGNTLRGYGNMLIIRHANGFLSVYAHNRKLLVREGATVRQGQTIAEMGQTETTQPSLYFEVRQDGRVVDPRSLLPKR
ncbi:LysM peptidoglycan-binding domain-containing protein [Kerstersia gyiorum]|uniref:peptidoglycan DD-metalloendopeptidase family protein n=1 Tax=Kerstersia gyiorum TaxID=206506 RepID=UPI00107137B3|nr:peptidoglycan DD-metalloendopeptidase family protein [Kerstersia gyiorum]QBR40269.1 LysM peptidoglycan-binding domain-containing protein [Kerstersia gyiorum]